MTANLPEPLPRGVVAGRDVLASRTAELARQQRPAVVWQRAMAAGTVPAIRGGTLVAGNLSLDISTGHALAVVPAAGGSAPGDGLAGTGTDQGDGDPSWAHLASAGDAVVLAGTAGLESVVAVHDRETGRQLWEHRWPERTGPGGRTADVRGGAVLTREGAFIRARRLRDGELLWSVVPAPSYGWFGDAGRHPASQWARLPRSQDADLFIHAPTGQALSIAGTFHHTGDDLVLAHDGRTLTCLALPGSPHRPAPVLEPVLEPAEPGWTVTVNVNPRLPPGGDVVSAIVTVTAVGSPPPCAVAQTALMFLIDVSAAMNEAWLAAAQEAVAAALGQLRAGSLFAVVAGAEAASMVYPDVDQMAVAGARTLAEARRALNGLTAGTGGIAVGRWLRRARLLLQPYPEAVRHAQLLVAGVSGESPADLAAAITHCEGIFRCDCRGVGTNWEVAQLRRISGTLLGTVDIVTDPRGLAADVAALTESAVARRIPGDVHLRLRPAEWARVRLVKQIAPRIDDLTSRCTSPPELPAARDYPTGPRQPGESRDYHVALDVTPGELDVPMQACHVSAMLTEPSGTTRELAGEAIQVEWVTEPGPMNPRVASYTSQAELARDIQDELAENHQQAGGSGTEARGR